MRRIIYDKEGVPRLYITGAGVVYGLGNQVRGFVQTSNSPTSAARVRGWFDGSFLWDVEGYLVGFIKGAKAPEEVTLPKTQSLKIKPQPIPALLTPFLQMRLKPELHYEWSARDIEECFLTPSPSSPIT